MTGRKEEGMKIPVRFKEKVWTGNDEHDDWETWGSWTEEVEARNINEALQVAGERCRTLEQEASRGGDKIKVSCEIEVSISPSSRFVRR
jgi:hypothetical protein